MDLNDRGFDDINQTLKNKINEEYLVLISNGNGCNTGRNLRDDRRNFVTSVNGNYDEFEYQENYVDADLDDDNDENYNCLNQISNISNSNYLNHNNDYLNFINDDEQNQNADLDIDTIRNEFQNSKDQPLLLDQSVQPTQQPIQAPNSVFSKFYSKTSNSLITQTSANPVSVSLSTGLSPSLQTDSNTNTIQINEDDLIDLHDMLKNIFIKDFFENYECVCDQAQGIFVTKHSKFSKSLQRKLITLYQLLMQGFATTGGVGSLTTNNNDSSSNSPSSTNSSPVADLYNLVVNHVNSQTDPNLLIKNSIQNQEYKKKLFRLLRSLTERILIDALSLCDQYNNLIQQEMLIHQQQNLNATQSSTLSQSTNVNNPTSKLWCEIRNRGCQFLGPQMQDDVLRLILHALDTVNRMSRKVLVLYVVHMLKKHYPKASKTSVGHVVQLLYRAGCFKVEKRDNDSSLMELRKEFSKYPALRRQHDTQIIQIALESGIRMSPEQWSQKLFGDSTHKSEMQSIIDKLQSQQTLEKLIKDFYDKIMNLPELNETINSIFDIFRSVKSDFEFFASINFEKKQPTLSCQISNEQSSQIGSLNNKKRNSIASIGSSSNNTNNIGSGGESLASEDDDLSYDNNDLLYDETLNEFNDLDFDQRSNNDHLTNKLTAKNLAQQKQQIEQTKIVWSLLAECMKKALKILISHIEYSSKMMSIIISNQNSQSQLTMNLLNSSNSSSNIHVNQAKIVNGSNNNNNNNKVIVPNTQNKISINFRSSLPPHLPNLQTQSQPINKQQYDSINVTVKGVVNQNQSPYLVQMGPNSNKIIQQPSNNRQSLNGLGQNSNKPNIVQNNKSSNNNNNNRNNIKKFDLNNKITSNETLDQTYLNKNQFGFILNNNDSNFSNTNNTNKIWSDVSTNNNKSNRFDKTSNGFNNNRFQQNNFFDSNSFMMMSLQDQPYYLSTPQVTKTSNGSNLIPQSVLNQNFIPKNNLLNHQNNNQHHQLYNQFNPTKFNN